MSREELSLITKVVEVVAVGVAGVVATVLSNSKKRDQEIEVEGEPTEAEDEPPRKKRPWARDWVLRRDPQALIYSEFALEDPKKFHQCFRMSRELFERLLDMVYPFILRKDTVRESIKPNLRLLITLRYLASGCDYGNLEDSFKIPKATISKIVAETCRVLWEVLASKYITCPKSSSEWLDVAKGFETKCNYPFSVGALDGKHCSVQCFANSGSLYHNYKSSFSIVLLGISDANLRFLYVDIGVPGSKNDASIWNECDFKKMLDSREISFPEVPRGTIPYHLLRDDAFGLTDNLLKPFPRSSTSLTAAQKIFNYRFSRGRRVVENAFGVMATKFRILRRPITLALPNAINVVKSVVCLHNFLLHEAKNGYIHPGDIVREDQSHSVLPGNWENEPIRNTFYPLANSQGNRAGSYRARLVRDSVANYFQSDEGKLSWQEQYAHL